jgi:hypothetical protein
MKCQIKCYATFGQIEELSLSSQGEYITLLYSWNGISLPAVMVSGSDIV